MRNTRWPLVIIGAALTLAGCGASGAKRPADARHASVPPAYHASAPPVCNPRALDAMARFLKVAPQMIATSKSIGQNTMPQCTFTTSVSGRERVQVIANVDSSPSPYDVLERTIEEQSQIFGPQRLTPAPVNVPGLGIVASWFPNDGWLKATDGLRLITATVDWKGARQKREIALAQTMIRPYLETLSRKQVEEIVSQGGNV